MKLTSVLLTSCPVLAVALKMPNFLCFARAAFDHYLGWTSESIFYHYSGHPAHSLSRRGFTIDAWGSPTGLSGSFHQLISPSAVFTLTPHRFPLDSSFKLFSLLPPHPMQAETYILWSSVLWPRFSSIWISIVERTGD